MAHSRWAGCATMERVRPTSTRAEVYPVRPQAVSDSALLLRARRALHDGTDLPPELRSLIRQSWRRSLMAAVEPDRMALPYLGPDTRGERLCRAAEPVLARFAQQLAGTHVSVVLADPDARVVGRWAGDRSALRRLSAVSIEEGFVLDEEVAGTNGIGTALEELAPILIYGAEHYVEPLQRLVCAGVPVRNPLTRRVEGVLNLACPTADANGLLLPTLLDLAGQIERELSGNASERERRVFEAFLSRSRDTVAPLVALGERFVLTNAPAGDLLQPSDQALLWDQAAEAFAEDVAVVRPLRLANGDEIQARCTPVRVGGRTVGALLEVEHRAEPGRSRQGSAAWARAERAADAVDLDAVGSVRVIGEAGTGRLGLARRLHARRPGTPALHVVACTLAGVEPDAFLAEVHGLLAGTDTVVLTDADALAAAQFATVADLVASPRRRAPVVTTLAPAGGRAYRRGEERLGAVALRLPPLRERREDVPALVAELVRGSPHPAVRVGQRAMAALVAHTWPGNLAELAAVVEEAVAAAAGADVEVAHLPQQLRPGPVSRRRLTPIERLERDAIAAALQECRGNKNQAAAALGLSRSTLYRRLRRYGLDTERAVL